MTTTLPPPLLPALEALLADLGPEHEAALGELLRRAMDEAARAERAACADICDACAEKTPHWTVRCCAEAIRARGERQP